MKTDEDQEEGPYELTMEVDTLRGSVEGMIDIEDVFLILASLERPIYTQWGVFFPSNRFPQAN